jgi:Ca2+-binding RTX toxin-like protein
MATVVLHQAIDITSPTLWDATLDGFTALPTEATFQTTAGEVTFRGTFVIDIFAVDVITGTISSIEAQDSLAAPVLDVTGLTLDVATAVDFVTAGNVSALVGFVFAGADSITGSSGADILPGLGGNDTIRAGVGNDSLDGGAGNDLLVGQGGRDLLVGGIGIGTDRIFGGGGSDTLIGGGGRDLMFGDDGADRFVYQAVSDSRHCRRRAT